MSTRLHWENVYGAKAPNEVSWFRPHLETSLRRSGRIIDVGGGESTLVDDLLARGYPNLTVLDICRTAIEVTKARLGVAAAGVKWLVAGVTVNDLPVATFGRQGPAKCSGLEVERYDADSLHGKFGRTFRLIDGLKERHQTPFGTTQQFLYCFCRVE